MTPNGVGRRAAGFPLEPSRSNRRNGILDEITPGETVAVTPQGARVFPAARKDRPDGS